MQCKNVDETAVKLLIDPPETVISFAAKPVAASLAVNRRQSLVIGCRSTSYTRGGNVIAIVGTTLS